jgi:RND family efflux transporter MFP subunit
MIGLLMKRWLMVMVVVLLLPGVGWVYLQARHARDMSNPGRARAQDKPIPVRTEQVTEKETDVVIGGTAITLPSETAIVRVGNVGRKPSDPVYDLVLKARHVSDGSFVRAGELLFELDDELFRQIVKEREISLEAAAAELDRIKQELAVSPSLREMALAGAQERMTFHKEQFATRREGADMAENLYRKGALGLLDWFDAKLKFAQAKFDISEGQRLFERAKLDHAVGASIDKAKLATASAKFDSARIDLEAAQAKVKRCQIKSPVEGFVTDVSVVPGQVVQDNGVVAEVLKLDPVFVRMDFPQERLDEIAVGQKADVVLDSFPKETFQGTVVRILPQVNANLRVLPVVISVSNPKYRIKAGVSGFVRLRQTRKTLTVPAQAILQQGSKAMVFRVEEGRARIREVTAGPIIETGMMEVREGLAAGDEIVVFHNFYANTRGLTKTNGYLQDNDPIDPNWRQWARRGE